MLNNIVFKKKTIPTAHLPPNSIRSNSKCTQMATMLAVWSTCCSFYTQLAFHLQYIYHLHKLFDEFLCYLCMRNIFLVQTVYNFFH